MPERKPYVAYTDDLSEFAIFDWEMGALKFAVKHRWNVRPLKFDIPLRQQLSPTGGPIPTTSTVGDGPDQGWRQGRHQAQNLYEDGQYVGVMFAPHTAARIVDTMNADDIVDADIDYSQAYTELAEMRLAVLRIHGTYGDITTAVCHECLDSDGDPTIYPCPTARALGVTS